MIKNSVKNWKKDERRRGLGDLETGRLGEWLKKEDGKMRG
jgi:hypothetical protein